VKAHFHRVRILANTLYQVVPDDAPDIKEEMGRFLLKLKAADWNAKQINLVHDTEEDAVLEEVSAKREKKGRFGRKAKKEDESGNESPGKKSPRAVKAK
jgi:non-homologous end joining protein Ku